MPLAIIHAIILCLFVAGYQRQSVPVDPVELLAGYHQTSGQVYHP